MTGEAHLKYSVSMQRPSTRYFDVEIHVSGFARPSLRLVMPVWTPGSYLVREYARNVIDFQATDARSSRQLKWSKDSKNSWLVETQGAGDVIAKYRVYAFEFTVDTSYLDDLHGIINGASVFMYVEGLQDQPFILDVYPPHAWKKLSTSLQRRTNAVSESESYVTFDCANFDILVDSPIEIGNQETHSFNVSGIEHEVSIYSPNDFDKSRLVEDLKRIVENTIPIVGVVPYNRVSVSN